MKGYFQEGYDSVRLKKVDNKMWALLYPLKFVSKDGVRVTAKTGFKTDGGTVPRFLWPIVGHPLYNKYVEAFIIHDKALSYYSIPKNTCDRIFLEVLDLTNPIAGRPFRALKHRLMYLAVVIGSSKS